MSQQGLLFPRPARSVAVFRAPGPYGLFVQESNHCPEQWRFEGWPANDNKPRARPTFDGFRSCDDYYEALSEGLVIRE